MSASSRAERPIRYLTLVIVLLAASALRFTGLTVAPPGLRYDELLDYRMALRILDGERPVYFSESWGEEPLFLYLQAVSLKVLGHSDWSLRLPAPFLGVLGVCTAWLAVRRFFGRNAALLSAVGLASSFWSIFYARQGLRLIALAPLHCLMVYFAWRGLRLNSTIPSEGSDTVRGARRPLALWAFVTAAGLCMGLAFYVYPAARVTPLLWVAFGLYLWLFHRPMRKQTFIMLAWMLVVALSAAAPILWAIYGQPGTELRLAQLSGPVDALREGNPIPILELSARALGMFFIAGDQDWLYNVSGRPVFDWLSGVCFMIGIVQCIRKWRKAEHAFCLLWLGVGLLPTMVAPPPASLSHAIAAQSPAYTLMGLGLAVLGEWVGKWRRWARPAIASVVLVSHGLLSGYAYFVTWVNASEVRELHQGGITAVAQELSAGDTEGPVAIGAPYVNYWHPWNIVAFELALRPPGAEHRESIRWFNPAGAMFFPSGGKPARYYFPNAPLGAQSFEPFLWSLFLADARPLPVRSSDYAAYVLSSAPTFERQLAAVTQQTELKWPGDVKPEAQPGHPTPGLPLEFGERFALLGAELETPRAHPGGTLRFYSYWEVKRADATPVIAFVHLTATGEDIWGQQDWLDVWPGGLQPGDRFIQLHHVPVQPETPPGQYALQLGLYRPDTLERLPITCGPPIADRVWVATVQIDSRR